MIVGMAYMLVVLRGGTHDGEVKMIDRDPPEIGGLWYQESGYSDQAHEFYRITDETEQTDRGPARVLRLKVDHD